MMTEEEARKKWCPFARQMVEIRSQGGGVTGPVAVASANRFNDDKGTLCVASGCMAWRWGESKFEGAQAVVDAGHGRQRIGTVDVEIKRGYCGLAGKP